MKKLVMMLLATSLLVSCGKEGPMGPTGLQGAKGDTGLTGPQGLQGEKGDSGDDAITSVKVYEGTINANPYTISTSELIDLSKQLVNVYVIYSGSEWIQLPSTYTIGTSNPVWSFTDEIIVGLQYVRIQQKTNKYNGSWQLLTGTDWGAYAYKIIIRTFSSAPAMAKYLANKK